MISIFVCREMGLSGWRMAIVVSLSAHEGTRAIGLSPSSRIASSPQGGPSEGTDHADVLSVALDTSGPMVFVMGLGPWLEAKYYPVVDPLSYWHPRPVTETLGSVAGWTSGGSTVGSKELYAVPDRGHRHAQRGGRTVWRQDWQGTCQQAERWAEVGPLVHPRNTRGHHGHYQGTPPVSPTVGYG